MNFPSAKCPVTSPAGVSPNVPVPDNSMTGAVSKLHPSSGSAIFNNRATPDGRNDERNSAAACPFSIFQEPLTSISPYASFTLHCFSSTTESRSASAA